MKKTFSKTSLRVTPCHMHMFVLFR